MTDSDNEESTSSSDASELLCVSLNKIRSIEVDLVKALFGRERAAHYIKRTNGIRGLTSFDQCYQDLTNGLVTETLTESIETLTITGGNVNLVPVTVVSLKNTAAPKSSSCCEICFPSQKVYPTKTTPYSQYSVCILWLIFTSNL